MVECTLHGSDHEPYQCPGPVTVEVSHSEWVYRETMPTGDIFKLTVFSNDALRQYYARGFRALADAIEEER